MTQKKPAVFAAKPVQAEVVSGAEYLRILAGKKRKITETRIVAPELGKPGFGGIFVRYRDPVYKVG
jgi:hypothetical protein